MTNPVFPVAKAMAAESVHAHDTNIAHEVWDSVVGGFDWLKSVIFGEFADNRSLSAIVADMLVSFLPGVVIVTSARDAIAVILRMAQHPEKRKEPMEWVLLCACLIVIALPLAMAAAGAVAAGVGAAVGGLAGTELGAALRAVMLLLIKEATKLVELLRFLQKFIHGDVMKFLRAIEFARYEKPLLQALKSIIGKLIELIVALRAKLLKLPSIEYTRHLIGKLAEWESKFYAVQEEAVKQVPAALHELQARLAKVLAEVVPKEVHTVASGVKVEKVSTVAPKEQRVSDVAGRVLDGGRGDASRPSNAAAKRQLKKASRDVPPANARVDVPKTAPEAANTKKRAVADASAALERERISQLSREAAAAERNGDVALAAAKKEEARSVLRPYLPKKPGDTWEEVVKRLDVSSPRDGAVFWSGDPQAAKDYAERIGGVALETTDGGRIIDGWDEVNKGYPWNADYGPGPWASDLWKSVSAKYAEGASGTVNVIQTPEKLWDPRTIWHNQEKGILKDLQMTGQVDNINLHVLNSNATPIQLPVSYEEDLLNFDPRP